MLNVLALFSGIGGFSLGLEQTGGFETVAFCEIAEYPRKILKKHWPKIKCYPDIKKLTYDQLKNDGHEKIDVIVGGYPCQPFSIAGRKKGEKDTRLKHVYLSEKGLKIFDEIFSIQKKEYIKLF